MFLFDLIFLKIFRLLLRIKNDVGETKWSSSLYVSMYFACTVIITISVFGLFHENYVSNLLKKHPLEIWMVIFILSPVFISIRYYRVTNISSIEKKINSINERFRMLINIVVFITMVSIPILTFVLFRLFTFGQVRWW